MLSNDSERSTPGGILRRASSADAVLFAIPFVLATAVTLTVVPSVSLLETAAVGASASLGVMGYALSIGAPEN